jgi:hypothetical protein
MPKLTQQIVEQAQPELDTELTPTQQAALRQTCREYQSLDAQIKVLEHKRDEKKARLGQLRDEAGVQSLSFEGWKVTLVGNVRKVLNKKRLIALGCRAEWLAEAEELKPSKPYEKVTAPGAKPPSYQSDED